MIAQSHDYSCIFTTGDGIGGTEFEIEALKGIDCVEACVRMQKTDATINGVRVYSDTRKGCWCEQNMRSVKSASTQYKSCFIRFKGRDILNSISCFFVLYMFCSNNILWCTSLTGILKLKLARLIANYLFLKWPLIQKIQPFNTKYQQQNFFSRLVNP